LIYEIIRHTFISTSRSAAVPELWTLGHITRMTSIIYLGLAVALTTILTAITCRRQIARKKQPSSCAMLVGAFSASAIAAIFSLFYFAGASVYSLDFWTNPTTPGVRGYLLQWVLTSLMCVVPAAFVVTKFQRKIRQ
jgi:hypothetical protein